MSLTAKIKHILGSSDDTIKQQELDAIHNAVVFQNIAGWLPLDKMLIDFCDASAGYLIYILLFVGFSGHARYIPTIEKYLAHPDHNVRLAAEEAMVELMFRVSNQP